VSRKPSRSPFPVRTVAFVLAIGLATAAVRPVAAATFADMDLEALVDASARVVRGIVVDTRARSLGDGDGRIVTDVTVAVDQDLLADGDGDAPVVVFATLGGVVGDRAQRVPGLPTWRPGDEVVLFLGRRIAGDHRAGAAGAGVERRAVVGLALGAFFVHRPVDGGPARVARDLRDASIAAPGGAPAAMPGTLDGLARAVRERAARNASAGDAR